MPITDNLERNAARGPSMSRPDPLNHPAYSNYYVVTLGCFRNDIDSDNLRSFLSGIGMRKARNLEGSDLVLVNTCGFITEAREESIETILEISAHPVVKERQVPLIILGCMGQRYGEEILEALPEVSAVVGVGWDSKIEEAISAISRGTRVSLVSDTPEPARCTRTSESEPLGPLYIRIADGCDNHCSYCALPGIRGTLTSRPSEDILDEVRRLTEGREREVVLVAQDLTSYGLDLYGRQSLAALVRSISEVDEVRWLRLLYLQPLGLDETLLHEISSNEKVTDYLDIPFQHASERVLTRMNRGGSLEDNLALVKHIRDLIPQVALRSTVMVGFPGEDEADFLQLEEFIDEACFDWLGVFRYSREEGTPARDMADQVTPETSSRRYDRILELQDAIAVEIADEQLGRNLEIVIDGPSDIDRYGLMGRSFREAPVVDGAIYLTGNWDSSNPPYSAGDFVEGTVVSLEGLDLVAGIKTVERDGLRG